uniref:hypothetical protein n=1 Tax=uncultured Draconibacterium sp. TaxID=1573823 RepID=UPI0032176F34
MKAKENNLGNRKKGSKSLKSIVVLFALIMVCTALNGQGLWLQIQTDQQTLAFNEKLPVEHSASFTITGVNEYLEPINEAPLEAEGWMMNEFYFNTYSSYMEVDVEETLKIENWMVDDEVFVKDYMLTEKEEILKIENWMIDENYWK